MAETRPVKFYAWVGYIP